MLSLCYVAAAVYANAVSAAAVLCLLHLSSKNAVSMGKTAPNETTTCIWFTPSKQIWHFSKLCKSVYPWESVSEIQHIKQTSLTQKHFTAKYWLRMYRRQSRTRWCSSSTCYDHTRYNLSFLSRWTLFSNVLNTQTVQMWQSLLNLLNKLEQHFSRKTVSIFVLRLQCPIQRKIALVLGKT